MLWKAAYNLLFLNPKKKASVPGMSVLFTRIADLFPGAPFFYLSTSPWNVESSIRNFITDHGFPEGPLLLRDLDPRPKTFVPSGPQHKLEFAEQLMADFPDMKFILVGDDGQKDPTRMPPSPIDTQDVCWPSRFVSSVPRNHPVWLPWRA